MNRFRSVDPGRAAKIRRLCGLLFLVPVTVLAQPAGVQTCAGCHGPHGEGNPAVGSPRIAGQPEAYLARQLDAYGEGSRLNNLMTPIARQLAPEQRAALSAYYSQLGAASPRPAAARPDPSSAARGQALATRGDESRRLQACENCHGPGGKGFGDVTPYLAGLDRRYLEAALQEWKDGSRKTDPSGQMNLIGKSLTDSDIRAIAAYYMTR
jgi:cytochrome c553